jgi:hypothetical protein
MPNLSTKAIEIILGIILVFAIMLGLIGVRYWKGREIETINLPDYDDEEYDPDFDDEEYDEEYPDDDEETDFDPIPETPEPNFYETDRIPVEITFDPQEMMYRAKFPRLFRDDWFYDRYWHEKREYDIIERRRQKDLSKIRMDVAGYDLIIEEMGKTPWILAA